MTWRRMGNGGIAPRFLNLGSSWMQVASLTLRPWYPIERERESGVTPIGGCMGCQGAADNGKPHCPAWSRTPHLPVANCSRYCQPTELNFHFIAFLSLPFDTGLFVRLYSLLCPWAWQLYRLESPHVPRHPVRAVVVRDKINETVRNCKISSV